VGVTFDMLPATYLSSRGIPESITDFRAMLAKIYPASGALALHPDAGGALLCGPGVLRIPRGSAGTIYKLPARRTRTSVACNHSH